MLMNYHLLELGSINRVTLSANVPVSIKTNLDIEHFGEKALLEYKDQRELRERLHIVDEQLSNLHGHDEDEVSTRSLSIYF
jgi:hypothetical protein